MRYSMVSKDAMKLIDAYRTDDPVIDKWTFVTDEVNPWNGYSTMIATDDTGRGFSQFCEGLYEYDGENKHLGYRPRLIGETLVNHVLGRMTEGEESIAAMQDYLERADMPQE